MARLMVVALLWMAGAVARPAGAEDYGGAGIPQYGGGGGAEYAAGPLAAPGDGDRDDGGGGTDYRGHSPDAPAPLDYKYEEESQGNTEKHMRDNIESETWKQTAKKQRGLKRDRDELIDSEAEPLSKFKSNRHNPRRRPRLKSERSRVREKTTRARRLARYGRSREHDDTLDYVEKTDYRDHRSQIIDEEIDTYNRGETTERIIRRKPRDRLFGKPLKSDELDSDEDMIPDRLLKEDNNIEYVEAGRRRRPGGGGGIVPGPGFGRGGEGTRPALDEEDEESARAPPRAPPLAPPRAHEYRDYSDNDYTDMRRVQNIKSKLPMLLWRTTTRPPMEASPTTANELLALLWTAARRGAAGDMRAPAPTASPATPAPRPPSSAAPDSPEPSEPPERLETNSTTTVTTPARTSSESTSELSIAEKSRISILKKAQKKESVKSEPSRKPAVLLQVTSKLPTVVMVEPPTSADPWLRARAVADDSPQRLEQVKRLMRHKLVARASSIQDLTDNWDEVVCDYIDVSLLNAAAPRTALPLTTFLCVQLLCLC